MNSQKYKDYDIFCEPQLFSIVVLACGRPDFTKQTVLSLLDSTSLYTDEIEYLFIENGECEENYQFFQGLNLERKVIVRQSNAGINEGLNQGWALSRGEFIIILENDWLLHPKVNFLQVIKDILNEKQDIGLVQLRAINDLEQNWGAGKEEYWPWYMTKLNKVKVWKERTLNGHEYLISDLPFAFTNNPVCIRKQIYRELGPYPEAEYGHDPRHGETIWQTKFYNSGAMAAHINLNLFYHIGQITTKQI